MITTSPDGQWAAVRRGREVSLFAGGAGPETARIELPTAEADLVIVGPPSVLAVVTRGPADDGGEPVDRMVLYLPPYLDAVARLDLDAPMRIAAVTGPRVALVSLDGKAVTIVRIAGRGLSSQALDPGSPVELAVGLDRNQILFGLHRKLEAWDAVSGRPLLRMQLPLPPPPRTVGPAHGHLWATQPGRDDIIVCRLSDGRPFHHRIGAPIDEVIYHPASPLLVLATPHGLVRLHCFAHALTVLATPWRPGTLLAQLVVGDDISLLGIAEHDDEPWQAPIGGAGAPPLVLEPTEPPITSEQVPPAPEPGEPGEPAAPAAPAAPREPAAPRTVPTLRLVDPARSRTWRDPLAAFAADLARGSDAEPPAVAADTELGQLAHRLALPAPARLALIALYSRYLAGEPSLPIARLAHLTGNWAEALGQGELHALAMLRRRGGQVALRSPVSDLLDGVAPRAIRVVGEHAISSTPRALRIPRDGKSDAAIEAELVDQRGRIAVIEGSAAIGLLEASLHGLTAVALVSPLARPAPWPRNASLIVVADTQAPAWVSALPTQ